MVNPFSLSIIKLEPWDRGCTGYCTGPDGLPGPYWTKEDWFKMVESL